jgi:hypothetical protein
MSSLKLAKGITPAGRILMIDTERGSGDLYADLFDYDIITLQPPYKPEKYVEAIRAGEEAGYDTIILDSLSHAWSDEGGILDQADKLSAGGNRFTVWAAHAAAPLARQRDAQLARPHHRDRPLEAGLRHRRR